MRRSAISVISRRGPLSAARTRSTNSGNLPWRYPALARSTRCSVSAAAPSEIVPVTRYAGDSAGDPVCTSSTSEAPTRHHAGEFVETAIKHGVCPADERRQRAPKRGEHGRVERPPGVRQEGWAQGPVGRGRDRGEEGWLKDTLRVSAKPVRHLAKRVGTGHSESPWPFYTCLYVRSTNASCILCVYSFCNRTLRGAATPRCHAARGPRRSGVFLESVRPPQPVEGPSSTPL